MRYDSLNILNWKISRFGIGRRTFLFDEPRDSLFRFLLWMNVNGKVSLHQLISVCFRIRPRGNCPNLSEKSLPEKCTKSWVWIARTQNEQRKKRWTKKSINFYLKFMSSEMAKAKEEKRRNEWSSELEMRLKTNSLGFQIQTVCLLKLQSKTLISNWFKSFFGECFFHAIYSIAKASCEQNVPFNSMFLLLWCRCSTQIWFALPHRTNEAHA